jgi:coenzyme F420-reducing hydrogenase delta subunit
MLLELSRREARGVLVAGCLSDRCRFGEGARMAGEQVRRAQQVLALMGADPGLITSDWSGDRAGDPIHEAVLRMVNEALRKPAAAEVTTAARGE